jgi:hypothetical protein
MAFGLEQTGENMTGNCSLVRSLYYAFGCDPTAIFNRLDPSAAWISSSTVKASGRHSGVAGAASFFKALTETLDFEVFEPRQFVAAADNVIVIGRTQARVKITGRKCQAVCDFSSDLQRGRRDFPQARRLPLLHLPDAASLPAARDEFFRDLFANQERMVRRPKHCAGRRVPIWPIRRCCYVVEYLADRAMNGDRRHYSGHSCSSCFKHGLVQLMSFSVNESGVSKAACLHRCLTALLAQPNQFGNRYPLTMWDTCGFHPNV